MLVLDHKAVSCGRNVLADDSCFLGPDLLQRHMVIYFRLIWTNEIGQNGFLTVGTDVLVGPQSYFNEKLCLVAIAARPEVAPYQSWVPK